MPKPFYRYCFIFLFLLPGCQNIQIKTPPATLSAPVKKDIHKFRVYDLNYDLVWHRAVNWFIERNIQIDRIEISSGYISAKYLLKTGAAYFDCGKKTNSINKQQYKPEVYGALSVTVKTESVTTTRVDVNFFNNNSCHSTGQIETDILNSIGKVAM